MLYISRRIMSVEVLETYTHGMMSYGVVDSDDGVETELFSEALGKIINDYHLKIAGAPESWYYGDSAVPY